MELKASVQHTALCMHLQKECGCRSGRGAHVGLLRALGAGRVLGGHALCALLVDAQQRRLRLLKLLLQLLQVLCNLHVCRFAELLPPWRCVCWCAWWRHWQQRTLPACLGMSTCAHVARTSAHTKMQRLALACPCKLRDICTPLRAALQMRCCALHPGVTTAKAHPRRRRRQRALPTR